MDERLIDIRTELAASPRTRVEIGQDGVLHVLAGPVTLHLDRAVCEELTTTLARAMVALARAKVDRRPVGLRLVREVHPPEALPPEALPPEALPPEASPPAGEGPTPARRAAPAPLVEAKGDAG